jgi:hypothetical protein
MVAFPNLNRIINSRTIVPFSVFPTFLTSFPICRSFWLASMACSSSEQMHRLAAFLPCVALTSIFLSVVLLSHSAQDIFISTQMIQLSFGTGCL